MEHMVSRRNFIIISIMMIVLFGLFQFSLVLKDRGNEYDKNEYIRESALDGSDAWQMTEWESGEKLPERDYVVYIGGKDQEVYNTIRQWCIYSKRDLVVASSVQDYILNMVKPPRMILFDGANIRLQKDWETIKSWTRQSVPMAFCTIPGVETVKSNELLREILGIDYVMDDSVDVVGIHVFPGFLLGGENIYQVFSEADEKRMDLELTVPWYHTFNGTKSYIMGMFEETPEETDRQPSLLWRYGNSYNQVFVVCGDYIKDLSGMGYLEAMLAEASEYDLYPVVNAQSLSIVNFPSLAEENSETIAQIYSRKQSNLYKELIWPNLIAVMEESGFVPTCFLTPKFDYNSSSLPSEEELVFYLKQFKEQKAETGLSEILYSGGDLQTKVQEDTAFFANVENDYVYSSLYEEESQLPQLRKLLSQQLFSGVKTIVSNRRQEDMLLSYEGDSITVQAITHDAFDYKFSDDLRLKGYETALGYSNVLLDMTDIAWPKVEDDEWQKRTEVFSSNVCTYWKPFGGFDRTTASENDWRIRNFLSLDYTSERMDNIIHVSVSNFQEEAWFILRTHGEDVRSVLGGSCQELEEDVYLIRAEDENVLIELIRISEHRYSE